MLSDWFSKTANRIRRHIFITITESKAHIGIVHRTKQKPKREGRIFDFGTEVSTPFLISSPLKLLTWIKIVEANLRWLAKYTPYPNDITLQPTVRISIKTKDRYF